VKGSRFWFVAIATGACATLTGRIKAHLKGVNSDIHWQYPIQAVDAVYSESLAVFVRRLFLSWVRIRSGCCCWKSTMPLPGLAFLPANT